GLTAATLFTLGVVFHFNLLSRPDSFPPRRIGRILAVGAVAAMGVALFQRVTGGFLIAHWFALHGKSRVTGTMPDPNSFGTYLAALAFLFAVGGGCGVAGRLLRSGLVALLIVGIILTGSRAAWGGVLAGTVILAAGRLRGWVRFPEEPEEPEERIHR